MKQLIAVFEVKLRSANVREALSQLAKYYARATRARRAQEHTGDILPAYLLHRRRYTKLVLVSAPGRSPRLDALPWQYIFQDLGPGAETAPLSYRLSELAVRHWES